MEGGTPTAVDLRSGGENLLVSRSAAEVEIRPLSHGGAEFIHSIAGGKTIYEAAWTAVSVDSSFDLLTMLAGMVEAGTVVAYQDD